MKSDTNPQWLQIAREIQQLSQTGIAFAQSEYEKKRYSRLTEIAAEIVESNTQLDKESVILSSFVIPFSNY